MFESEELPIARLVALDEAVGQPEYLLSNVEHTLGRSKLCTIVVGRETISRIHARIMREGPRYVIYDAGSANGTYINGQPVGGPHVLSNRDDIGLGSATPLLRFIDPDPTVISSSRLRLDERTQTFYLAGQALGLPPTQQRLLTHLYRHIGELCSRESCAEAIWGRDYDPGLDAEALDKLVSNLRASMRKIDDDADLLRTRRGMGFVLMPQAER